MEAEVLETPESVEITDLSGLERKMSFTGTVVKTTLAGAVVDIGMEVPGVVHISQLQTEPVNRVEDVVQTGDQVKVWVRRVFPKKKRVELTMIEPLALEWREISKDMVLTGKVTRLEKFGAFVEVGAERPGLVHISEMTHDYIKSPSEVVKEGDEIEVKVLSVNPKRKQIKLSMKALQDPPEKILREIQKKPKQTDTTVTDEPVPTAMEIAMREAMERSKDEGNTETVQPKTKSKNASSDELENILARTLEQRK
jgi:small subunit ribosomal protein S1